MSQSENEAQAARLRGMSRIELIKYYESVAIEGSEEFGFLNIRGHEVPDPTIVEPPLGYVHQPDLMTQMRLMVQREISAAAAAHELETFADAEDFDIDEDPVDYASPWEQFFDPDPLAPAGPEGQTHPMRQDPNATPEPDPNVKPEGPRPEDANPEA